MTDPGNQVCHPDPKLGVVRMSVGCTFSSHTEDGARPSKALLIQLESHSLFNSDTLLFTYMMGWIAKGNFSVVLVLQTSVIQKVQWTVWVSHC